MENFQHQSAKTNLTSRHILRSHPPPIQYALGTPLVATCIKHYDAEISRLVQHHHHVYVYIICPPLSPINRAILFIRNMTSPSA